MANAAAFIKSDTTQGSWMVRYGGDGHNVIGGDLSYPSYVTVTPSNQLSFTWAGSTADQRALSFQSTGIAACWFTGNSGVFTVDVNISDGQSHQLAIYVLDWDGLTGLSGLRSQTIDILDGDTSAILATFDLNSFVDGVWLAWNVSGHIVMRFTCTSSLGPVIQNAVVSGIFFDPPSQTWSNKATIVQDHTQITADLTNFPTLVKITDPTLIAGTGQIQNTGSQTGTAVVMPYDLIFTSDRAGNMLLPWEIDTYDPVNGVLWAWVLVDLSSSVDITFYMWFGNTAVGTQQNIQAYASTAVWTDYAGVWHLGESAGPYYDSTVNANNGATTISTYPTLATGQVGGGQLYTLADQNSLGNNITIPANASLNIPTFSISLWLQTNDLAGVFSWDGILCKLDQGTFEIWGGGNTLSIYPGVMSWSDEFYANLASNITHMMLVQDNNTQTIWPYVDGVAQPSLSGVTNFATNGPLYIGSLSNADSWVNNGNWWVGMLDEVRVAKVALPPERVTAEYVNQNNPLTFHNISVGVALSNVYNQTGDARIIVTTAHNHIGGAHITPRGVWNDPVLYRVGETDRPIGEITTNPEGFYVLNLANRKAFIVSGGVWTAANFIPPVIVLAWSLPYNVPA